MQRPDSLLYAQGEGGAARARLRARLFPGAPRRLARAGGVRLVRQRRLGEDAAAAAAAAADVPPPPPPPPRPPRGRARAPRAARRPPPCRVRDFVVPPPPPPPRSRTARAQFAAPCAAVDRGGCRGVVDEALAFFRANVLFKNFAPPRRPAASPITSAEFVSRASPSCSRATRACVCVSRAAAVGGRRDDDIEPVLLLLRRPRRPAAPRRARRRRAASRRPLCASWRRPPPPPPPPARERAGGGRFARRDSSTWEDERLPEPPAAAPPVPRLPLGALPRSCRSRRVRRGRERACAPWVTHAPAARRACTEAGEKGAWRAGAQQHLQHARRARLPARGAVRRHAAARRSCVDLVKQYLKQSRQELVRAGLRARACSPRMAA